VASEQVWPQAEADVSQHGMTPEQAVDKATARIKMIFSKYVIA
jgi:multiple sugar transport system substrate-binding protein